MSEPPKQQQNMSQSKWEADKMLDVYIYDYLMKRNLQATAEAFMSEGKVSSDPVAIDAPGGFLFEWWSVFWDIFIARTNPKHSEAAAAFLESQQMKLRDQQQQLQMQQLIQQRHLHVQSRDPNQSALNGTIGTINSDPLLGSPTANVLTARLIEEHMKNPNSINSEASPHMLDSRMTLLKSPTNTPGQLIPRNSANISAVQQLQAQNQRTEIKGELNVMQRSFNPSMYAHGIGKPVLSGPGLNQAVSALPLKGWPVAGIEPLNSNIGMQKSVMPAQNQVSLPTPQQITAQAQAHATQGNLGVLANTGDLDPQRFKAFSGGAFSGKYSQPNGNDGSIGSPVQSVSSKMQPSIQQASEAQQPLPAMQSTRKRKPTASGAANSNGTGNHGGSSQPSTPSTHTPGDVGQTAGSLQHINVSSKSSIYGPDGMGGFASSSNQMDALEQCADVGFFEDNVDSFLSNDDGDARDLYSALKRDPIENNADSLKGPSISEIGCIRPSNSKVVCCHFSSDGKVLASAGHDKKVTLWNMENLQTDSKCEEHSGFITDIRFRSNSMQLATSSADGTVKLWNAADRGGSLQTFRGHGQVTSLDFHPKVMELFCFCDDSGDIHYWSVGQNTKSRVSRGVRGRVRFQSRIGHYLATTSDNAVNIIDIDKDVKTQSFKGHSNEIANICWDETGDYLASVSQESAKVWSLTTGECIHDLSSNGNSFHSCTFHPRFPKVLVIGGYQSLELWSTMDNHRTAIQAHEGSIVALAQSPIGGFLASASHDRSVKIWK